MNSFPDKMAEEQLELQKRLMSILKLDNPRECERKLFAVLGTEKYQLIHQLVKNKTLVYFGTRYYQAQDEKARA